jgi:hypothetical protein
MAAAIQITDTDHNPLNLCSNKNFLVTEHHTVLTYCILLLYKFEDLEICEQC